MSEALGLSSERLPETVHVINASCLDPVLGLSALADESIDATITDPPYEAEAHTLQRRQKGMATVVGREEYREVSDAPLTFDPITPEERADVALQITRITRRCALVFCQVEAVHLWRDSFDEAGELIYRRTIPWLKPDAMPSLHGRWPGQAFEALALFVRTGATVPIGGKAVWYQNTRAHGAAKVVRKGQENHAPHPTTKPLRLMLQIVDDFTLPGELVADPYAGSGTTLAACNQLGRRGIGWEINAEYAAIANRRIHGGEAKPRPEQPSLF